MLINICRRSAATQNRPGLKKYRGGKNKINILLSIQTESNDSRPSRSKKYRGKKIRLIYCFICRRRAVTQDRPGASPLPLHLFSYADVCCCTMTYAAV